MKFKYLKKDTFSKIIWYKNPNECVDFNVERVNPDHIGILWGFRKKSSKGRSWMQIAKIYFSIIPVVYGLAVVSWLDAFTSYTHMILLDIGLFSIIIYSIVGVMCYLPIFKRSVSPCPIGGKS